MSKNYSIWGKSNFHIRSNTTEFLADKSECKLEYQPIPTEIVEDWSGEIIEINMKYRAILNVEIKQFIGNYHIELIKLTNILKYNVYEIRPFYTGKVDDLVLTGMLWTNGLSFEQMVKLVEAGQSVPLKFKAKLPIYRNQIPTNTNDEMILGYQANRKFYM